MQEYESPRQISSKMQKINEKKRRPKKKRRLSEAQH
jgi:hypothetical protein